MDKEVYSTGLCLLREREVGLWLQKLQQAHPGIAYEISPSPGALQVRLQSHKPLAAAVREFEAHFATYAYGEGRLEEAVHRALLARKKTLALAESCTGGEVSARLAAMPGASSFLLGSLVVYSNRWKEHFLHVSSALLEREGAVNASVVRQMAEGLFQETSADYAVAISGVAGPAREEKDPPVGTIYFAVGQRGEASDIGSLHAPLDRRGAIDFAVQSALGVLWRRAVHNARTFS